MSILTQPSTKDFDLLHLSDSVYQRTENVSLLSAYTR